MDDTQTGLYHKFDVKRTDGSSEPGGKHENCFYVVLDLTHDKFSKPAVIAYAEACAKEYPVLAKDLLDRVKEKEDSEDFDIFALMGERR